MIINNIQDLAVFHETTVEKLPYIINTYTDSKQKLYFDNEKIIIHSIAFDNGFELSFTMFFPFDSTEYEDNSCKLECIIADLQTK